MDSSVIGCGRWGSFIAWYLAGLGQHVTLYGREGSPHLDELRRERRNGLLALPDRVALSSDLSDAARAETLFLSVPSQSLRPLAERLASLQRKSKTIVLCMKGLEAGTGCRLSTIVREAVHPSNDVAVWLGPGHVQDFCRGIPNCMVIDSDKEEVKGRLVDGLSGPLIRFYYGQDLIGNEVGAAAKNVIGIAAGFLDGLNLSTLKGALMSRGTREVARLIAAMGGSELSAYGLCHLGDYEATLFSPHSHNRLFGERKARHEEYGELAEGVYTVQALVRLGRAYGVELPICEAVHGILYENKQMLPMLEGLLSRSLKNEF